MEDYKKKYEDAVKELKKFFINNDDRILYKHDIERVFPELKESEDERIRKEIISFLKEGEPYHCPNSVRRQEWATWLEKQGEQKPQGKRALEVWKDMRLEVYQQASGNRHEPNYSDDSTKMFSLTDIDEIFEKVAEKQGEQKPAWSEEDEMMLNHTISTVKLHLNDVGSDKKEILLVKEEIDWLKSLKERMKGE